MPSHQSMIFTPVRCGSWCIHTFYHLIPLRFEISLANRRLSPYFVLTRSWVRIWAMTFGWQMYFFLTCGRSSLELRSSCPEQCSRQGAWCFVERDCVHMGEAKVQWSDALIIPVTSKTDTPSYVFHLHRSLPYTRPSYSKGLFMVGSILQLRFYAEWGSQPLLVTFYNILQ